jgi:hypothetical protein
LLEAQAGLPHAGPVRGFLQVGPDRRLPFVLGRVLFRPIAAKRGRSVRHHRGARAMLRLLRPVELRPQHENVPVELRATRHQSGPHVATGQVRPGGHILPGHVHVRVVQQHPREPTHRGRVRLRHGHGPVRQQHRAEVQHRVRVAD